MSKDEHGNRLPDCTNVLQTADEICCATSATRSMDAALFVEVPLDERLADNPLNARHALSGLEGLEASIRARGILQPLIVARAQVFRLARPEVRIGSEAEWVLLAGHRRRAAARSAGIETASAIVRDDLVKNQDSAMVTLIENVHRAGLGPLEEARVLSVLRDLGLSQREISCQTGISQGQVSKRLQLLELPAELQDRIDRGDLTVADALTILRELNDPHEQLRASVLLQDKGRTLKHVLRQLRRERVTRDVTGEQVCDRDVKKSSDGLANSDHDGNGDLSLKQQQSVVLATAGSVEFKLANWQRIAEIKEGGSELTLQAAACAARLEACRQAVRSDLSVTQIVEVLVDAILDPPILLSAQARDQAHAMAAEWTANSLPPLKAGVPHRGLPSTLDAKQRLAFAIVLAHREIQLASIARHEPWHEASRRHVRRLAEWGMHSLTAYDRAKLDEPSILTVN